MDAKQVVLRDERTEAVENVGLRWGANFVMFALLIDVVCRGVFFDEAAWDLLFLAAVPGFTILFNHARHKTLNSRSLKALLVIAVISAVCAFIAVILIEM